MCTCVYTQQATVAVGRLLQQLSLSYCPQRTWYWTETTTSTNTLSCAGRRGQGVAAIDDRPRWEGGRMSARLAVTHSSSCCSPHSPWSWSRSAHPAAGCAATGCPPRAHRCSTCSMADVQGGRDRNWWAPPSNASPDAADHAPQLPITVEKREPREEAREQIVEAGSAGSRGGIPPDGVEARVSDTGELAKLWEEFGRRGGGASGAACRGCDQHHLDRQQPGHG